MRYLTRRSSGIWYFRYQIPPVFRSHFSGQTEYKRSLHTRCRYTAKLRSAELQQRLWKDLVLIEQSINEKRIGVDGFLKLFQVNERNVFGFSDELKKKIVKRLTHCIEVLESQPNLLRAQLRRIELREEDSHDSIESVEIIESLCNRSVTPLQAAKRYLSLVPFAENAESLHYSEEIINVAIKLFRYVYKFQQCLDILDIDGAKDILNQIINYEWIDINDLSVEQDPKAYYRVNNRLSTGGEKEVNDSALSSTQPPIEKNMNIQDILNSYVKEMKIKGTKEKTITAVIKFINTVHELIGKNDPSKITRDDAINVIEDLFSLPTDRNNQKNEKYFGGLTALEAIEKNKEFKRPTLGPETVLKHISKTSGVYRWACEHLDGISKNPFSGLSSLIKKNIAISEKERKQPFSIVDLKEIFSHKVFVMGKLGRSTINKQRLNYQYWVPLICLLSSMRPNECCQLLRSDVQYIDGILCFQVTSEHEEQSLKNNTAKRIIPVHNQLISFGFDKYLESVKGDVLLFPELTYTNTSGFYGKVETWFRRQFTEKMGLTEQSKSFYSFRHAFIDFYAKNDEIKPIHRQLVGHLNGDMTNDVYGSKYTAPELKKEIDKINFESVFQQIKPWKLNG